MKISADAVHVAALRSAPLLKAPTVRVVSKQRTVDLALLQPFEDGAGLLFFFAGIVVHEEQWRDFAVDARDTFMPTCSDATKKFARAATALWTMGICDR